MSNARRKNERRKEISELVMDGRLAHRTGKPRSAVPFKPFESMNAMHWLKGWDAEEQERLNEHARSLADADLVLFAGIEAFEQTGDRTPLCLVLRAIVERLPPWENG